MATVRERYDGFESVLHAAAALTRREQALLMRRTSDHAGASAGAGAFGMERTVDLPDKLAAIKAAARVFEQERIAFALIGGLAVGIRSGVPRATIDVDFAIPTSVDRPSLIPKLVAAGFRLGGEFPHSIKFRHESGEPVQLAFDAGFDPMIERAELVQVGDIALFVVTREDLIAMKRRAASDPSRRRSKALRDQADISLLEGDVPSDDEGW